MARPPPLPRSSTPSPFVVSCLQALTRRSRGIAGDLGCGYGRHARLLASMGYTVLALDLDHRALRTLGASSSRQFKRSACGRVYPVIANVEGDLPLKAGHLDLA